MMTDILVAQGVPNSRILPEDKSTSTLENIQFALPLLSGKDVLIVTDAYHAKRALMVAKHFGLTASVDSPSHADFSVKHLVREACARQIYAMKLRFLA